MAALFRLFGASDATAVAWPLAGSLLAVVAAYLVGRDLVSRRVGLIAAALVAVAPLEVLLATRLRPDAIMPGLVALAVWCALRARRSAVPLRWAAGAGLLLGAGWSVRESALVMAPIVLAAGWGAGRRALAAGAAGLAAVPLGAAAVFAAAGGSPLSPLLGAGEAGEWHDPIARWSLDGSYLGQAIRGAGRPGTLLFLALPVLAVAGVALLLRGDRRALLPAGWLALAAAYLEFGTLVNLDKPVRFLTLCTIPAALLVALALSPQRGLRPAFAALVPVGVAVVAVMALAPMPGREHRADDVFLAGRVAGALRDLPRAPVLAEDYTWWSTFRAYLPAGRLAVPRAEDPAFLSPAQRRERRRMVPLPDPADYAGGYVVTGPVHPRAGWPSNWGAERRLHPQAGPVVAAAAGGPRGRRHHLAVAGVRGAVTIVIPARDEAATVGAVVRGARARLPRARVLVVDDGSRDATGARGPRRRGPRGPPEPPGRLRRRAARRLSRRARRGRARGRADGRRRPARPRGPARPAARRGRGRPGARLALPRHPRLPHPARAARGHGRLPLDGPPRRRPAAHRPDLGLPRAPAPAGRAPGRRGLPRGPHRDQPAHRPAPPGRAPARGAGAHAAAHRPLDASRPGRRAPTSCASPGPSSRSPPSGRAGASVRAACRSR